MTLVELGALGELVGGVAIIVSLVYVGLQLKQSNTMARTAVQKEITSANSTWAIAIASSPSLAETIGKVHFEDLVRDDASDTERIQVAYALFALVANHNFMFQQWKVGAVTDAELEEFLGAGSAIHTKPYLKSAWPILRVSFPVDFAEWYEARYQLKDQN